MSPLAPDAATSLLDIGRRELPAELIAKLSAPFVLSAIGPAKKRLLVLGQETYGWGGSKPSDLEGRLEYWLSKPAPIAAEVLAAAHAELFLSDGLKTPFWEARRALLDGLGGDWTVVWSNLMRVDTSPLSTKRGWKSFSSWQNLSYPEVDAICAWQAPLHRSELAALKPDAMLFLTGPNYDYCINKSLAIVKAESVLERDVRIAARLRGLPVKAFRTYHPNYLRRRGHWDLLAQLARLVAEECA